jgi:hypothetical protein
MKLSIPDPPTRRLIVTRRRGVEVNVSGKIKHITLGDNYSLLDTGYEISRKVDGGSSSMNDRGLGAVRRSFAGGNEYNLNQNADGDFPIRSTTFFAPGAPIGAWGGIRFTF